MNNYYVKKILKEEQLYRDNVVASNFIHVLWVLDISESIRDGAILAKYWERRKDELNKEGERLLHKIIATTRIRD